MHVWGRTRDGNLHFCRASTRKSRGAKSGTRCAVGSSHAGRVGTGRELKPKSAFKTRLGVRSRQRLAECRPGNRHLKTNTDLLELTFIDSTEPACSGGRRWRQGQQAIKAGDHGIKGGPLIGVIGPALPASRERTSPTLARWSRLQQACSSTAASNQGSWDSRAAVCCLACNAHATQLPHLMSSMYESRPAKSAVSGPGRSSRGGTAGRSPASTACMILNGAMPPQGSCQVSSCSAGRRGGGATVAAVVGGP